MFSPPRFETMLSDAQKSSGCRVPTPIQKLAEHSVPDGKNMPVFLHRPTIQGKQDRAAGCGSCAPCPQPCTFNRFLSPLQPGHGSRPHQFTAQEAHRKSWHFRQKYQMLHSVLPHFAQVFIAFVHSYCCVGSLQLHHLGFDIGQLEPITLADQDWLTIGQSKPAAGPSASTVLTDRFEPIFGTVSADNGVPHADL